MYCSHSFFSPIPISTVYKTYPEILTVVEVELALTRKFNENSQLVRNVKDKVIGGFLALYVGTITTTSIVGSSVAINKVCSKVECNGMEMVGRNYQKFLDKLTTKYKYL